MTTGSSYILEVRAKFAPDSLLIEWGMPVSDRKWAFPHDKLEVRLYADPFPDFGRPELMNSPLPDRQTTFSKSFPIPLTPFTIGREVTSSAFLPGTVFADPDGKCYPAALDLAQIDIPAGAVITYPALRWPAPVGWLKTPHIITVRFGATVGGKFEKVGEFSFSSAEAVSDQPVLPDVVLPAESAQRIRRRGAAPKIFISYSRRDIVLASNMAYALNRKHYYDVWIDFDSLRGGALWDEELAKGIQQADTILFLMSPDSVNSKYCKAEILHALKYNKTVVPIKIRGGVEPDDLSKVGLSHRVQIRDLTSGMDGLVDGESLLPEHLFRDLPVHLERDQWMRDKKNRELHRDYLRAVTGQLSRVELTYLLDAAPKQAVDLSDIYVPLKLSVGFNIEVLNGQYAGWWLRDVDASDTGNVKTRVKPKTLYGFAPHGAEMEAFEHEIIENWARYKADHDERQAKKPMGYREPLEDMTYRLERLEAEVSSALMPYVVITGEAGSGKSTLMKHLAACMAGDLLLPWETPKLSLDNLNFWPHAALTPLFIDWRDLVGKMFPNPQTRVAPSMFFGYVRDHLLKPLGLDAYLDPLRQQMGEGDVLLCLDGLDEVPNGDDELRPRQIRGLIAELKNLYPRMRMVITARPYAYRDDWRMDDLGFGEVRLSRLPDDRLRKLAKRLFQVVLGQEGAKQEANRFVEQVNKLDETIWRNPLYFTLLASIWVKNVKTAPDQRWPTTSAGQIYARCIDILFERWKRRDADGKSLGDVVGLNETQLRDLLERLAYDLQSEQSASDKEMTFKSGRINDLVRDMGFRKVNLFKLYDALGQRSGVIEERAPNQYKFAHRTFQEYLAACYLARPEGYPSLIVKHAPDLRMWQRVFHLLPDVVNDVERLWLACRALLPARNVPLEPDRESDVWVKLYWAARWMHKYSLPTDEDEREAAQKRTAKSLEALVTYGALPPIERAEMGRILGIWGDTRKGIGLGADGLPEFDWVDIPAGEFIYGYDDKSTYPSYEQPADRQTLNIPAFQISRHPLTYRQFQAFIDAPDGFYERNQCWWDGLAASPSHKSAPGDQAFKFWNHPRERVSWYDAIAFCRWLSYKLGGKWGLHQVDEWPVCLPTEFEWEKAARGTDGRIYPYDDEFHLNKGNTHETGIGMTSAVGIFPEGKSPYGVLDMSGNVWEWSIGDVFSIPSENERKHICGGSWYDAEEYVTIFFRGASHPENRSDNVGFRLVLRPPSHGH
jgi:formylglycine-generating enzyme required for sulfatase activity/energy-coupling factor transporter ATP-binding protein EcfA2